MNQQPPSDRPSQERYVGRPLRPERPEPPPQVERRQLWETLAQAPAGIAILEGPAHVYTLANQVYRELVGGRDLIGRTVREALPELLDSHYLDLLDDCYRSGRPVTKREAHLRLGSGLEDGEPERYVDFVYQPLRGSAGSVYGILVHAVEVTESVRARKELTAARLEAERANRAKAAFLAAMSHDVRTPLNAATGFVSLLADELYGPITAEQATALDRIQTAHAHLITLIEDILQFSKLEAGSIQLRPEALNVPEVVEEVRSLVESEAANRGLLLACDDGPAGIRAQADRERVVQILLNLLTNALKFTARGEIRVSWDRPGQNVAIHVRDTGDGIAAEDRERIFEPFIQTSSGAATGSGVGLGLAISRNLARAMGGDLTVEAEPGHGSTFTLTLPRADE